MIFRDHKFDVLDTLNYHFQYEIFLGFDKLKKPNKSIYCLIYLLHVN